MIDHPEVPASRAGQAVGFQSNAAGPKWLKRFNAEGVAGLDDLQWSGKPVTHSEEVRSQVIELVTQRPSSLGYPFALWTLRRLQTALAERLHLHVSPSTLWEWLTDEGLAWKRQES